MPWYGGSSGGSGGVATSIAGSSVNGTALLGDMFAVVNSGEFDRLPFPWFHPGINYSGSGIATPAWMSRTGTINTSTGVLTDSNGAFLSVKNILGRAIQTSDIVMVWRGESASFQHWVGTITSIDSATQITLAGTAPSYAVSSGNVNYYIGPPNQHTAINNALIAARDNGGGALILPGFYFCGAKIEPFERTSILGMGHGACGFILQDSSNCNAVEAHISTDQTPSPGDPNATFLTLAGFSVLANGNGQSSSSTNRNGIVMGLAGPSGVFSRSSPRIDIDDDRRHHCYDLEIWGAKGDGLQVYGLSSSNYEQMQIYKCGRYGVNMGDDGAANGLADSVFTNIVVGLSGNSCFYSPNLASTVIANCKGFSAGENYSTSLNSARPHGTGSTAVPLQDAACLKIDSGQTGGIVVTGLKSQENRGPTLQLKNVHSSKFEISSDSCCINMGAQSGAVDLLNCFNNVIEGYCFDTQFDNNTVYQAAGVAGTQRHAISAENSRRNRIVLTHEALQKNDGTSSIYDPVFPGFTDSGGDAVNIPATDLTGNDVKINGEGGMAFSPWYATAAAAPTLADRSSALKTGFGSRSLYAAIGLLTAGGLETPVSNIAGPQSLADGHALGVTPAASFPSNIVAARVYVGTSNSLSALKAQPVLIDISGSQWKEPKQQYEQGTIYTAAAFAPVGVSALRPNPYEATDFHFQLGGNATLYAPPYARKGQKLRITLEQDATGGRKVTWPSGSSPLFLHSWIQNLQASHADAVEFKFNGTDWVQSGTSPALIFANSSVAGGDTLSNFTGPSAFATNARIPAGQLKAGQVIKVRARGIYSTTSTPTFALDLLGGSAGSTVLVSGTNAITGGNGVTNAEWDTSIDIVVLSLSGVSGASGVTASCEIHGTFSLQQGNANSSARGVRNSTTGNAVSLATDVDQVIGLQITCSAASASNTITQKQLILEQAA
jgi:hypothetical protein